MKDLTLCSMTGNDPSNSRLENAETIESETRNSKLQLNPCWLVHFFVPLSQTNTPSPAILKNNSGKSSTHSTKQPGTYSTSLHQTKIFKKEKRKNEKRNCKKKKRLTNICFFFPMSNLKKRMSSFGCSTCSGI